MTSRRALRRSAPALLLAVLGGCSNPSTAGPTTTRTTRQADTTGTPLWTVTYSDPRDPSLSVHDAAVDDQADTLVLVSDARQASFVYEFDPGGAFLRHVLVRTGSIYEDIVRANDTGFVVAGTAFGSAPSFILDRFDPSGNRLFATTVANAAYGAADVCGDGTTVAVYLDEATRVDRLVDLDAAGNVQWTVSLGPLQARKARCLGDGTILVAGTSGTSASAAQYESDGTRDWMWQGGDALASGARVSFDIDGNGNTYVGTSVPGQIAVYALDGGGNLSWSWMSGGSSDSFSGISVSDVVAVTGARGGDFLSATLDASGNVLWTRDDAVGTGAAGVSLDDADDAFVCGAGSSSSSSVLYGPDGTTRWSDSATPLRNPVKADFTNGVARCIGAAQPNGASGIGIVAFEAP